MTKLKYRKEDGMRDSGILYLGKVPSEWKHKKFKYIFSYTKGRNPKVFHDLNDRSIPYVNAEYLRTGETGNFVNSGKGLIKSSDKDILLLWDGANAGEVFQGKVGVLGSTFAKLNIIDRNKHQYLKYYMDFQQAFLKDSTYGMGIPHVNSQVLNNLTFFLPVNIQEEKKISNFLDIKTSKFDSIISKKELLIEKLEEAKKSLISEVVTGKVKIVNGELVDREPHEMKDSGIKWLGWIPKKWSLSKVGLYYDIKLGKMLQPNQLSRKDTLEKYLCTVNVDWDGIRFDNVKEMWFSEREKKQYSIASGDLIVNEGGDAGKAGIVKKLEDKIYIQNAVHRVRGKGQNKVEFLYYWLYTLKSIEYIELICNKATIMHFTLEKFKNLIFLVPKYEEQIDCFSFLDNKVGEINSIINKTEFQIQKLKQAKQSLISEAVTGKIDLRDWEIQEI